MGVIHITENHAHSLRLRRGVAVLLATLLAAVALPAFASAQQVGPTDAQYDDSLTQVGSGVTADPGDPGDPRDPSDPSGRVVDPLPFTGLDVGILALIAATIGGAGFALRRAARSIGESG